VQLNGSRKVIGVLRGYDVRLSPNNVDNIQANVFQVFLNIVLDDAVEEKDGGEKVRLGMVVSTYISNKLVQRGC
jgi:small nuclear ribonucleoprotein G